ncbi:MAG: hypothetical protein HYU87_11055 [Chloroflexi bacterium]|nr:hypothetical protein [Chloroflexota bacterium]
MAHGILGALRVTALGGFLAFGLWSALSSLLEMEVPAPRALPTALVPRPAAVAQAPPARTVAITTISLSDRDLTRAAEPYFPQTYSGVTVSSPSVRVSSGRIVLTAATRSFFGSGPLVATATPSASDGRFVVRVDSVTLSGMTLPDAMSAQIAQQLQGAIDGYTGPRMQVTSVTTGSGMLTLKGTALP